MVKKNPRIFLTNESVGIHIVEISEIAAIQTEEEYDNDLGEFMLEVYVILKSGYKLHINSFGHHAKHASGENQYDTYIEELRKILGTMVNTGEL